MTNPATYLARSYATLDKHVRNARDIAPGAPCVEHMRIARQLLDAWRNRANMQCINNTDSE